MVDLKETKMLFSLNFHSTLSSEMSLPLLGKLSFEIGQVNGVIRKQHVKRILVVY